MAPEGDAKGTTPDVMPLLVSFSLPAYLFDPCEPIGSPAGDWPGRCGTWAFLCVPLRPRRSVRPRSASNLFEASAAGAYQSYGNTADLGSAFGGLLRFGLWLPLNFSVEAEGSTASAKANTTDIKVGVKTGSGSLLYNLPFGARNWGYAKLGFGGTKYGGDCAEPGARICGTTTMFVAGLGFRIGADPRIHGAG